MAEKAPPILAAAPRTEPIFVPGRDPVPVTLLTGFLGAGVFPTQITKKEVDFTADGRRERGDQPVVVACRNRVKFVIVAASAADGQAEHGDAGR